MIIRFHLRVSPGLVRMGMVGLLLIGPAGELCSEPVTMTSYYPAPSGVYSQMVATQNSYLARDGSSFVLMGPPPGSAPLIPTGTTKLTIMGAMGIGLATATSTLTVVGAGGNNIDAIIDGQIQTGDNNQGGGVWFDANAITQFAGQNPSTMPPGSPAGTTGLGLYNNGFWGLTVDNAGNVGILKNNPTKTLDVNGSMIVRTPCAAEVAYAGGNNVSFCPAGTYATWATGIYNVQQMGNATPYLTGQAFCCPNPAGGALF